MCLIPYYWRIPQSINRLTCIIFLLKHQIIKKIVVFCDISKAFDRVWHTGLIAKLSRIGITGNLLQWFQNYLSNCQQHVVVNGQCASWGLIKAGVRHESVLGPLLFLVYINDITFATDYLRLGYLQMTLFCICLLATQFRMQSPKL